MKTIQLEIAVDSIESALEAQKGGADRIELCDNLAEGGTTPSAGLIQMANDLLDIDVFVMIRPRGGDFYYSDLEFKLMKNDTQFCKTIGVKGIVIGMLNPDGTVDKERSQELIQLAAPMEVTFHRAYDMTEDPYQALEDIIDIGATRILTSGHKMTAHEGIPLIAELVKKAGDRITIVAGSGVNESNISDIVERTGVDECHSSATTIRQSGMIYKNYDIFMGRKKQKGEYEHFLVDSQRVGLLKKTLATQHKSV